MNDKTILIVVGVVAAFVILNKRQAPVLTMQQQQRQTQRNINNQLFSNLFGIGWTSLTNYITSKNQNGQQVNSDGVPIDSPSLMQYYDGEEPDYGWF